MTELDSAPQVARLDLERGELTLCGSVTIDNVEAIREQLIRAGADTAPALRLQLDGVTAIDTAGAQLLIALRRCREPNTTQLLGWPEDVRRRLHLTGLMHLLRNESRKLR